MKTEQRASNEAAKLLVLSLKRIRAITKHYFIVSKKLFWRFLELHIIKAVYVTAFVCAVSQVSLILIETTHFHLYIFFFLNKSILNLLKKA